MKRHSLLLSLLVGLGLRLIGIESRSLQYDDTFSFFLAGRSLPEIIAGTAADTMPPLYYVLLHFWLFVGRSVWFIRLFSVILSLAAVFLTFRLTERWLGRTAAGWAAFLAAISPLLIYHGQDVRMYALLTTAQLGYLFFFTRIWFCNVPGHTRPGDWIGLVLCGAAAMYSHNVAVFALAVPNLFLLFRREWKLLFRLVLAQAVIGLLALPWLLFLPGQIAKVQRAWSLPAPGAAELIQALIMMVASLPLPLPLLAIALGLSLQIAILLALALWRARHDGPGVGFLTFLVVFPPLALFAASHLVKPMFIPRAFLISSLAFDALAGYIIQRTWQRGLGKALAATFVLAALVSLPSFYTYQAFPRSPYRAAVGYLQGILLPGDRVLHETKLSYFPAHFYAPGLSQVFLADLPGSPNDTFEKGSQQAMQIYPQPDLETAVGDSGNVYFVTYSQTLSEYQAMGYSENPNVSWLQAHFNMVERIAFSDLEIYHYQRQD